MIEEINIYRVGSYDGEQQKLEQLKEFNYFYGANGAGKTTISKIINDEQSFPTCSLKWKNGTKLISFVYNRDFVDSNFSQDKIKGIFTLGSDAKGIEEAIDNLNKEKLKEQDSLVRKQLILDGNEQDIGAIKELAEVEDNFKGDCWKQKIKHDIIFQKAFEGLRNSAEKFKQRVISECASNKEALLSHENLLNKSQKLFKTDLVLHNSFALQDFSGFVNIASNIIWKEKILGRKDVGIADLIKYLNNSDWVKEGVQHYEKSAPSCPFCQQETNSGLLDSLSEYFDADYNLKKDEVSKLKEKYKSHYENFVSYANLIQQSNSVFLDRDKFNDKVEVLSSQISANILEIDKKAKLLSEPVYFVDIDEACKDILNLISDANQKIKDNNILANNKIAETEKLCKEIWAFIVKQELKDSLKKYQDSKNRLESKINGLKSGITTSQQKIEQLELKLEEEESKQTSVLPTISAINSLLRSFGFKNFKLLPSNDKNHYLIVRDGGVDASKTLSEGEKTFITFLYFYNLIKGSNSSSGILSERIVVFDDPISSLDSDILFIVTSLMKNIINEVREGRGAIKQIFFLTHNIYFHKELTFNIKRSLDAAMSDESFWVVKKRDKTSHVEKHMVNPIKTSYDLLWSELRGERVNCATIQNTLRRILENYFKILGGMDVRKLEINFHGHDKIIFNSLVSWINDGSHFSGDDLFTSLDEEAARNYMNIFQRVFEHGDHMAHYKMMMGSSYKALEKEIPEEFLTSLDSANDDVKGAVSQPTNYTNIAPKDDVPF